jgi:hypothetical protein
VQTVHDNRFTSDYFLSGLYKLLPGVSERWLHELDAKREELLRSVLNALYKGLE